ncbi:DNA-binding protein [Bacillus vallismortis]|uniref:DNA-binding protein n=1 Tax=Bacillus vallismortis TaxID=72361 RepID=UPI00399035C4
MLLTNSEERLESDRDSCLEITRQRLSTLVTSGKLKPVKKVGTVALFLRGHVQALKKELEAGRKKYRPYDE